MAIIDVTYHTSSTAWHHIRTLDGLLYYPILSLDIETKGVYSKIERKLALGILDDENIDIPLRKIASVVGHNSGLSFPSLVNVTHFVFGTSKSTSIILIVDSYIDELAIWRWIATYPGCFLIHNTLFDLKVMYHRIKKFPIHYEDTALIAKGLTNNSAVWKAKIGLKDLMGPYYAPEWVLFDSYEPDNSKNPAFLQYAAIDGAATFYLNELLMETYLDDLKN